MKKFILLLLMSTLFVSLTGQNVSRDFQVESFNSITAAGTFRIHLIKGEQESVTIDASADIIDYINVRVSESRLFLSFKNRVPASLMRNRGEIIVKVVVNELNEIDLSGSVKFESADHFSSDYFNARLTGAITLTGLSVTSESINVLIEGASSFNFKANSALAVYNVSGAAKLNIEHETIALKIEASGASKINYSELAKEIKLSVSGAVESRMTGKGADLMLVEVSGACSLDTYNFPVKEMTINATGVSKSRINVTEVLDVQASGGSVIRYSGSPQIKRQEVSAISSLTKIN